MRMRKKKNLLPRMERCAALQIKDPIAHRGHWRELMPEARELRVELGCGKGRFTVGTAAAEPDVLFVAVEMVPDAMVVAMERCAAEGLRNVRFIDANAPIAVRAAKKAINEGLDLPMDEAVVVEEKAFGSCFETADQQEGMGAFLEKRKHEPFTNK